MKAKVAEITGNTAKAVGIFQLLATTVTSAVFNKDNKGFRIL